MRLDFVITGSLCVPLVLGVVALMTHARDGSYTSPCPSRPGTGRIWSRLLSPPTRPSASQRSGASRDPMNAAVDPSRQKWFARSVSPCGGS